MLSARRASQFLPVEPATEQRLLCGRRVGARASQSVASTGPSDNVGLRPGYWLGLRITEPVFRLLAASRGARVRPGGASEMTASAVFILDMKGKVIISRNYRGDVPMNCVERFSGHVLEAEEADERPVWLEHGAFCRILSEVMGRDTGKGQEDESRP